MPVYSGKGDPSRTLALLWGTYPQPARGPKAGLDLSRIVGAAIAIADERGLDAVTMRALATELGIGTMSLYRYVPGKEELLDLMIDAAHGELPAVTSHAGSWREQVEAAARASWAHYHRHPWRLQIAESRPVFGPNETAWYDSALAALLHAGFTGRQAVDTVAVVFGYVRGLARNSVDAMEAEKSTGVSDDAWHTQRMEFWETYYDMDRFAAQTEVWNQGVWEEGVPDSFEFGLQRLLDGIVAYMAEVSGVAEQG